MERNDGGQAFPGQQQIERDDKWNQTWDPGMSLRDYFAAKAIRLFSLSDREIRKMRAKEWSPNHGMVAEFCYRLADAMLEARNK